MGYLLYQSCKNLHVGEISLLFGIFSKCRSILSVFCCHSFPFPGAYIPLTADGTIVVDGVLASCYASFFDHDLAHMIMLPMKWFPEILEEVLSSDKGWQFFVKISMAVGELIISHTYQI